MPWNVELKVDLSGVIDVLLMAPLDTDDGFNSLLPSPWSHAVAMVNLLDVTILLDYSYL